MPSTFVQVAPNSTGGKISNSSLANGVDTVLRQETVLSDPNTLAAIANVINAAPAGTEYGLVVRTAGPIPAGSNLIGTVKQAPSPTSALTSVSVTTLSLSILAANASRRGATVYNESGATLYLALSTAASLTAYTVQVAVGSYYEAPSDYSGALFGITSSGTAVCRVTEFT